MNLMDVLAIMMVDGTHKIKKAKITFRVNMQPQSERGGGGAQHVAAPQVQLVLVARQREVGQRRGAPAAAG